MGIYIGDITTLDTRYGIKVYKQSGGGNSKVTVVDGVLTQADLSVSGGNTYDSIMSKAGNVGNLANKGKSILETVSSIAGAGGSGLSSTPKDLTRLVWSGSNVPTFALNIQFICKNGTAESESVVSKVNAIMEYLYPSKVGGGKLGLLVAPAGYNPITKTGLITLTIGKWFRAKDMVIESAEFTYSKELNLRGEPIIATGQVVFKPFDAITFDEYKAYFTGGSPK